jgi:AraC-like DNA-binding protein
LVLGGQVQFQVEAKTFQLEPGDFLLINPQELHKALIGQGSMYERMVLWIDRNYLSSLCTENTDLSACFDGQTNLLRPGKVRGAQLQGLLESLAREYYDEQLGSAICAQGLLMQFLVELNRLARKNMGKALAEPDLVSQVIAYIGNHYQENLTLESLAGQFYVSKFYLSHEFRERVGVSIHRYIIFRRLLQAKDLMAAGIGPGQVYQNCGFGDYANFYRAFKAEYGISPREFVQGK